MSRISHIGCASQSSRTCSRRSDSRDECNHRKTGARHHYSSYPRAWAGESAGTRISARRRCDGRLTGESRAAGIGRLLATVGQVLMLELQAKGCHNINFVTPEHVVPQTIEALAIAVDSGLRVPIVYKTSAYDALEKHRIDEGRKFRQILRPSPYPLPEGEGVDFLVSELQPQRELDLALAVCRRWNDSGRAGNLIALENDQLGVYEVRMIEDVEGLDTELHVQPLLQRNPLEQRGVHVEETGSPKRAARDVSVGPGERQHERVGIQVVAGFLELAHTQNRIAFEVGIPVGHIRIAAVSVAGPVGANQRRNGKAALHTDDAVPLPVADQFFHPAGGPAAERFSVPERQLIEEVGAEQVILAVGRNSLVELQIVPIQDNRRLILMLAGEQAGIHIQNFRKRVTGSKRQSGPGALG